MSEEEIKESKEEPKELEKEEKEKEKEEEVGLEKEYKPPETIEVKPKEELEEIAEPLVDLYMHERGLSNRKQAIIKLLNVMSKIGYKPPDELMNIKQYTNSIKNIINSIPDYPETAPIKAALAGESAIHASRMLRHHFEGDPEMKEIIKYATRMAITMRILDKALSGASENQNNDKYVKALEDIMKRIEKLESERERQYWEKMVEERIQPIREEIKELKELMRKATEVSKETPISGIDKVVDKLDELSKKLTEKERDELYKSLKESIDKLPEKIGEYSVKQQLGIDAINQVLGIVEKLEQRFGKKEVGETDWKSTAITTIGDVIKDIVPRIVEGSKEEEAEEGDLKNIIDQKVLEYIANVKIYGEGKLNIRKCAEHLGITVDQVKDSLERLARKGLISVYRPEIKETKKESKIEKKTEEKKKEVKESTQQVLSAEDLSMLPIEEDKSKKKG